MHKNNSVNSVYIHIPFCKKICSYCDFCKNYYDSKNVTSYLNALKEEVLENYNNDIINTIYIGGGTPSSLSIDELNELFDIIKIFNINHKYEFTFECNYDDITEELLTTLKNNKVNRISIGLQTFNEKYESFLNRKINKKSIRESIYLTKKYFKNINIDLMYAIEKQTLNELKEDINEFLKLDVTHISTYTLMIEKHTKLGILNVKEQKMDKQDKMYKLICKMLSKNGYNHYEISNFSKQGYESRHNLVYWNNNYYYGFGLGASGFVDDIRYENTKSLKNYIDKNKKIYEEKIDIETKICDEVMLNLRKKTGVNKLDFLKKYLINFSDVFDILNLKENGFVIEDDYNIYIPEKYLFISNEIILKMLETKNKVT